jgi:hypothetical protein
MCNIVAVPMNMEEWQRKLKAEKDSARQKKTESAEILRGYRGELNDDELKLKALREDDRKKSQDAQAILHNYKGMQIQEGLTKSKEQRPEQHFPTPVNAGNGTAARDDVLSGIVLGSVSERAAALAAAAANAPVPTPSPSILSRTIPESTLADIPTSGVDNNHDDDNEDDEDDDYGPSLPTNPISPPLDNPSALQPAIVDPLLGESTQSNYTPTAAGIEPTSVGIEESVMVEKEQMLIHVPPTLVENVSPVTSLLHRVDVLFAFGLVTMQTQPNIDSYMTAVQSIVTQSLSNEECTTIINPLHPPYVKDLEWDCKCQGGVVLFS